MIAVTAAAVAAAALLRFDLSGRAFVAATFAPIVVLVAAIDLETRTIPNRIVVPAALIVLAANVTAAPHHASEWVIAAFATALGALALALATRGGIGMGDVKLCFLLGAGLGWHVLDGLFVAAVAAFIVAVVVLARRGFGARKESIPMGPFLAIGSLVALFFA